jgi:cell division protein FtsA
MNIPKINPKDLIFSLDIGTRSIIGTVGIVKDKKFHVLAESYFEHNERAMVDGQIHDIPLVAAGVINVKKELEKKLEYSLINVTIAAAGRFLRTTSVKAEIHIDDDKEIDKEIIRGLELTAVKKAEENINVQADGKLYCVGYSVKNYYLNGYVISNLLSHKGDNISVEVIATFLPRSVVDSLYAVMDKAGLEVASLTLEPIAAMEAVVPQNLRLLNIALVDIGAGTSDIAISSNDSIAAYGMVPLAGDEVTEAIAQTYLTDFNTAEKMKKECSLKDSIKYVDVIGMENEVKSEDIIKVTSPIAEKLASEVSNRIIDLNGGKHPNAVFLVGGGSHTQNLKDILAQKLNLPVQRIAIKGRESISQCVCEENELGSIGVTVVGIALTAIKNSGHDFINVTLNDEIISLFNSHNHTVMDLLLQAGINPRLLIGKKGKSKRFIVNDIKRVSFGSLPQSPVIKINDNISSMDSDVKDGDIVEIQYAIDGKDAQPKVMDFVKNVNSITFYLDGKIKNIEPVIFINGKEAEIDSGIEEGDNVDIILPNTISDYIKYIGENKKYEYYLGDKKLEHDYIIKEGEKINRKEVSININGEYLYDEDRNKTIEKLENLNRLEELAAVDITVEEKNKENTIEVIINEKPVKLQEKDKYVFIDIFNFIDFDLSRAQGLLVLMLNGKKAGYHDELNNGDVVEVYWKK